MRKYLDLFFVLFLFGSSLCYSQTKLLTLEDAITRGYGTLNPSRIQQLSWIPETKSVSYISKDNGKEMLFIQSISDNSAKKVLSIDVLNQSISFPLKRFPRIEWINEGSFYFIVANSVYTYDIHLHKATVLCKVDSNAANFEFEKVRRSLAFTLDNNLYFSNASGKIKKISNDTISDIVNGQSVHRNEFGISKGIFWSPKGNLLAYYRMDQSMVTDYPLVNIDEHPASLVKIKYPMAGMNSHQVSIGIYNITNEKTIWLKTGEPKDQYLTNVTWSPDENFVYVAQLNRDQNHMQLVCYDAKTGDKIKVLLEEKSDKYVEPLNGLIFLKNDPSKFLWLSRKDGWNHLYLYSASGNLIKQLTKGDWEITEFSGFDKTGKNILILTTKDNVLQRQLYKVNIETGEMKKLSKTDGTHDIVLDSNGEYYIDAFSSNAIPSLISISDPDGNLVKELLNSPNPLKDYKLGNTKLFNLTSVDGQKLYCRITLPTDFDSLKKYPVLVYVYGGPHSQLVTDTWLGGSNLWLNYMAQQGFVVFTLDNRGTSNRGLDFEQATFRHLGTKEIEDQITGVKYLRSLPYIDSTRIGVFGWSYGGFMSASLMTRASEYFKAGVAGGPVIDWSYYEVMYGERYMDTPQLNPEGYAESSLLNYVDRLKGKLLIVHGTMDPTVVWQNSLLFVKKAVSLGIPLDYFPYPGHEHGVTGSDQLHLYRKITSYFKDNL